MVKYFIDHYHVKFLLTGSAGFYLKGHFSETLAGRKFIFELFPLSFFEFLDFKGLRLKIPDRNKPVSKSIFDTFSHLYDEYIRYGGFPGVVLKSSAEEKKMALEEIFTSYFQMEVLLLKDFRRNDVFRDLILLLAQRIGSKPDIQKISGELGVSRPTVMQYLSFLEQTYFIKTIRPMSRGRDHEIRKMPKLYLCDTGVANHLARLDMGALFENSVFQALRLKGDVSYYQRKSGAEIDFIVDRESALEVKISPQKTDVTKLESLSRDLGLKTFHVIAKNYSDLDSTMYGFMV